MIDENIVKSLRDFSQWFQQYNQEKKDQQDFGVRNMPARVFRKTVDLSIAAALQNTGIPFNGMQVEKIYITATGASADGSVKLIFDRAMSDAQFNYKTLKENDSFTTGFSVAKGYLSWDAQPGMSADLVFFNDVDYKSGSQKTSITGTVTTSPANTSPTIIKQVPSSRQIQQVASATTVAFAAIATGFYGILRITSSTSSSSFDGRVDIGGGIPIFRIGAIGANGGTMTLGEYRVLAGEVVNVTASSTAGYINAVLESYPI